MKIKLFLPILLAFVFVGKVSCQEKLIIDKDTLITITPSNLKIINGIIVDWEFLKKESSLKDSIIKQDSILLTTKDSLITAIKAREEKKEAFYIEQAKSLVNENAILKKKVKHRTTGKILGTLGGTILGIILGLIIH